MRRMPSTSDTAIGGTLNQSRPILVIGDVILDRYTMGNAERISPEAPVPILLIDQHELRLGGAASVASLLRGLDASVILAGVVGCDKEAAEIRNLLNDQSIEMSLVVDSADRCTTTKERFVGRAAHRHAHQILRVDRESREPLPPSLQLPFIDSILKVIAKVGAVLIADYGKGVCTKDVLRSVILAARENGIPIVVDPARTAEYEIYDGATVIKPNRHEIEQLIGRRVETTDDAIDVARSVAKQYRFDAVLITLDRDGMVLATRDGAYRAFATRQRTVYDITGAGDMALAMVGLCVANSLGWEQVVTLANAAAGLEVERFGVATVSWDEITRELDLPPPNTKIIEMCQLATITRAYRMAGRSLVFTNGCFDLLHVGHLTCLQEAAALGDILVVGLNSDASVRGLKGAGRPVVNQVDRAKLLAGLECVDHVIIFDQDTPCDILHLLKPNVLAKGGTYGHEGIVGKEIVEAYGGKVEVVGLSPGISTTRLLGRIRCDT